MTTNSPRSPRGKHPLSKLVLDLRARVRVDDDSIARITETDDRTPFAKDAVRRVEAHRDRLQQLADQLVAGAPRRRDTPRRVGYAASLATRNPQHLPQRREGDLPRRAVRRPVLIAARKAAR